MSTDDQRNRLLHAIAAWREARDVYPPGTSEYKKFHRKMKETEWELHGLGSSQEPPGFSIRIVDPDKPKE